MKTKPTAIYSAPFSLVDGPAKPETAPVAVVCSPFPKEREADARLIAAAPDLLRGCLAAVAYLCEPASKFPANRAAAAEIIRAAIAKAEGRA